MHSTWLFVLVVAYVASIATCEKTQVEVWHSLGDAPFTQRGVLTYDPDSKKKTAKYEPVDSAALIPAPLLASIGKDVVYRVSWKHVKPVLGVEDVTVTATIRACLLQAAKFQEHYTLHIDEAGIPYHLDYVVDAAKCEENQKVVAPKKGFKINVELRGLRMGQETTDGKPQPEKSFLQKYWYYILAIFLIVMLSGGDGK
ncbi:hypothetical protein BC829DRAFT_443853 [Chytridium lagenaria]|nr:hypothetical protein BC829DRAFT_443853 [Chytridium lagenaria]